MRRRGFAVVPSAPAGLLPTGLAGVHLAAGVGLLHEACQPPELLTCATADGTPLGQAEPSYLCAELGKQSVDGKAGEQDGGDEEADCFGSPWGGQSPLILDALLADLDTRGNLEYAVRAAERQVPVRQLSRTWKDNFPAHETSCYQGSLLRPVRSLPTLKAPSSGRSQLTCLS